MIRTISDLLNSSIKKIHGLVSVDYYDTLDTVNIVLKEKGVKIAVVIKDKVPVGLITPEDMYKDAAMGKMASETHAFEVMSTEVISTSGLEKIEDASSRMEKFNIRHIVVKEEDEWKEILSIKDFEAAERLNWLELEELLELYKQSGWPPVS